MEERWTIAAQPKPISLWPRPLAAPVEGGEVDEGRAAEGDIVVVAPVEGGEAAAPVEDGGEVNDCRGHLSGPVLQ